MGVTHTGDCHHQVGQRATGLAIKSTCHTALRETIPQAITQVMTDMMVVLCAMEKRGLCESPGKAAYLRGQPAG